MPERVAVLSEEFLEFPVRVEVTPPAQTGPDHHPEPI